MIMCVKFSKKLIQTVIIILVRLFLSLEITEFFLLDPTIKQQIIVLDSEEGFFQWSSIDYANLFLLDFS